MIKGVTDMEYGPYVRVFSQLESDSQRWVTLQNAHEQVPVISQKFGGEKIYKSDDEYAILPLAAPA